MISVGKCPVCGEGEVGYRLCANKETVVLVCDACALVFMHPTRVVAEQAEDPMGAEFVRRHPDCKLRPSRWADESDLRLFGWSAYLLTVQDVLDQTPPDVTEP